MLFRSRLMPKKARKINKTTKVGAKAAPTPEMPYIIRPVKRICRFLKRNVSCPDSKLNGMMNKEGKFRNICNCNWVTCGKESWMRPNAGETDEKDMTANMDRANTATVSESEGFWAFGLV